MLLLLLDIQKRLPHTKIQSSTVNIQVIKNVYYFIDKNIVFVNYCQSLDTGNNSLDS